MSKKLVISTVLAVLLVLPVVVFGISIPPTPGNNLDIIGAINNTFYVIWFIFGAFAVLTLIYAGFLFLTAHGDPSKVSLAIKAFLWGLVGIAIALLSSTIPYIINFILLQS